MLLQMIVARVYLAVVKHGVSEGRRIVNNAVAAVVDNKLEYRNSGNIAGEVAVNSDVHKGARRKKHAVAVN